MSANIRQIMRQAIFNVFNERASKKSEKAKDLEHSYKMIFSYNTKFQLLDRVNDFCKSLPAYVKRIDDVRLEHIKNYLDLKAEKCTQATVDEYRSELKKLGKILNQDWEVERIFSVKQGAAQRGAQSVISREDLSKILLYAEKNPSKSGECIRLENLLGVRVSDLAYGITIDADTLHIRSKNGKICNRPITAEIRSILNSETFKNMIVNDKVVAPKDNSINRYLNRVQKKLGLEPHSFHDIRRRIAQDKYDELRYAGVERNKALSAVSLWLNHGAKREKMLLKSYISNAW